MEKSSIGSAVVRNASVLDPKVIHNSTNESLVNKVKVTDVINLCWIDAQY